MKFHKQTSYTFTYRTFPPVVMQGQLMESDDLNELIPPVKRSPGDEVGYIKYRYLPDKLTALVVELTFIGTSRFAHFAHSATSPSFAYRE